MGSSDDADAVLFEAVREGDPAGAAAALDAGANVNALDAHRVTPLVEACGQEHLGLVRLLIERGADVNYTGMREGSPLMLAAFMGQTELLRLLLDSGAEAGLAMPGGGETALHMAAATSRTDVVRVLLEAGADPHARAGVGVTTDLFDGDVKLWGETPLHFAAAYGDEAMIQALLAAGADRHATNAHGERPLAYAGRHKRPREIRDLLK